MSLHGRVELLLRQWEAERSGLYAACHDEEVPPLLQVGAELAAEDLGARIESLEAQLYD